ncbi:MAG: DUF4340 domain-containing protein [Candidatus Dadabacteria bacterium]|nr:MAG: DUF4340 domain-containing protein [Candidatus Dadabacteria bacterium]
MSLKKTLIFGLLFACLLLYIWKIEIPTEENEKLAKRLFPDITEENISSLKLKNESGMAEFKKDKEGNWRYATNGYGGTDKGAVSNLVSSLIRIEAIDTLSGERRDPELSTYGLDKPVVTVEVGYSGKRRKISLGKLNEYTRHRYAMLDGEEKVFLIPEGLYNAASKEIKEYRDKTPVDFAFLDLSSISVKGPKGGFLFKRKSASSWVAVKPHKATASLSALSEFSRSIRNLEVSEFIDPNGEKIDQDAYGFSKPYLHIELAFKKKLNKRPYAIDIGRRGKKKKGEFFLRISGISSIFKLKTAVDDLLVKDFNDFREKKLFSFATDEVYSAVFNVDSGASDGRTVKLQRVKIHEKDVWKVGDKVADKEADEIFVKELLKNLANLEAVSFPKFGETISFDKPYLTAELRLKKPGEKSVGVRKLLVVKRQKGKKEEYICKDVDNNEPFIISPAQLKRIIPRKETLMKVEKPKDKSASEGKESDNN